jgi:hypothetical protein
MSEARAGAAGEGRASAGWCNRSTVGVSLASLFSDVSHELATAVLPAFLVGLGAEANLTLRGTLDHPGMIGRVAVQKHILSLPQHVRVQRQVGPRGNIGFQSGDEPAVAVVVALHEVKIAPWMAGDQVVEPTQSMSHRLVGAR